MGISEVCDDVVRYRSQARGRKGQLAAGDVEGAVLLAEELVSALPERTEPKLPLVVALQPAGRTNDARAVPLKATTQDQQWFRILDNLLALWATAVTTEPVRQLTKEQ